MKKKTVLPEKLKDCLITAGILSVASIICMILRRFSSTDTHVPIATAFPVIISSQNMQAYNFYEYAVIFCIVFAAIIDSSISALYNKEFLTDAAGMSLTLSYFLICTVTAFRGDISIAVRMVTLFLLAGAFLVCRFTKKHSFAELLKCIPVAVISVICSWLFLRFGL